MSSVGPTVPSRLKKQARARSPSSSPTPSASTSPPSGIHESGLVFTSAIGTPLRASTMWTAWRAAARQVGTTASPHDLRHYFASVQISGGTSIKALQVLLGHKSAVETWDTYGHLMGDEDDRSRSVIHEWLLKTVHRLCTVETSEMRLRSSDGV